MEGDGSTITCTAGVCSAIGAVAASVGVGSTTVTSSTGSNYLLGTGTVVAGTGTLANYAMGTGLTLTGGTINTPWTVSGSNIANNNAGTVGVVNNVINAHGFTGPGERATVKIQRTLPNSTTYGDAIWAAYDASNNYLCSAASGASGLTTCVQTAISTAFPYASATTASGFDFELIGGNAPSNGTGHNYGGGADVLALTAPMTFPAMQGAKVRIGTATIGATINDAVIFDSCEICDIDLSGTQLVYNNAGGGSNYALHIKPTNATPLDGGFGFSPARLHVSTVVGLVRLDLSGNASANVDASHIEIGELNWGTIATSCGFLIDSPATGQNAGGMHIEIEQLHGAGTAGGIAFCDGTKAPAVGTILGQNYYNIAMSLDSTGSQRGFDEWGSENEIHLRVNGWSTGYTFQAEAGACRNTVFIQSSQGSAIISDISGCTGANVNMYNINGVWQVGVYPAAQCSGAPDGSFAVINGIVVRC
jgi:hypothetical protein